MRHSDWLTTGCARTEPPMGSVRSKPSRALAVAPNGRFCGDIRIVLMSGGSAGQNGPLGRSRRAARRGCQARTVFQVGQDQDQPRPGSLGAGFGEPGGDLGEVAAQFG
jgi:hypothetical protein